MRMGFIMRQQTVAAIHAKALRLNAAAVSHISQGHVVNLVSNDVRRFDDASPFWCAQPRLASLACLLSETHGHGQRALDVSGCTMRGRRCARRRVFVWGGPLELGMVLLMVSLELGFLPALAGVSATLLLIPLQVGAGSAAARSGACGRMRIVLREDAASVLS